MSFSLRDFDLAEMLRCGLELRRRAKSAASMEAAADAVVRYLYDAFRNEGTGERECALVRFYKTHPYGGLDPELQGFARGLMGAREPWRDMRCLVLLASAGQEPTWNARQLSRGHRAIPLPTARIVEQAPMIAQLIRQFGLAVRDVVSPARSVVAGLEGKTYNVFYVRDARGHEAIPAQAEFVERYGIRSVVGCGGVHPSGDLYAAILFSKVEIPPETADRFRNIALDLKLATARFREEAVFASSLEAAAVPA